MSEPGRVEAAAPPRAKQDPSTDRLLASRLDLLDLSLRNPLLNYRPSTRRGLEIVDEKSPQVFSSLVVARVPLRFHPTLVSGKEKRPEFEALEVEVGTGESNPENSLATPYTKEALAHRLLETHYDAWLSLQEQGANTLYVALGMLRWREAPETTQDRFAPLVLVPVRLERKSARAVWQLKIGEEDVGVNLSLVEKLKEFGIRLPATPDLEGVEGFDAYLAAVGQAVADKKPWAVERDRVVLGFFSFAKFLMYRDLDPELWPADRDPARHELLSAILTEGFRERAGAVAPHDDLDVRRPPGKTMEVMDADGSQAEALAEVASGRNLIIQGPPGTGKSQTISNLIAEAVWSGKKVLFVAEKMAALEVVKRRLDQTGLGDLLLELHSNKASKKEVAAQLGKALALGRPKEPSGADLVEALPEHREKLNRYAKAAALPVGETGVTPFHAVGAVERLKSQPRPLPRITTPGLAEWTPGAYAEAEASVQDLASKVADLGTPGNHPFEGCGLTEFLPGEEAKVSAALKDLVSAGQNVRDAAELLSRAMGAYPAVELAGLEAWCELARLALEAPPLEGVPALGPAWDRPQTLTEVAGGLERGKAYAALRSTHGPRLLAQAWDADVLAARGDLVAFGTSWWRRLLSGKYRAARRAIQGLCNPPLPTRVDELTALANAVLEAKRLKGDLDARQAPCRSLLGECWDGVESDWDEVQAVLDWGRRFRPAMTARRFPESVGEWVVKPWDREAVRRALGQAEQAAAAWRAACGNAEKALAYARGEELRSGPFQKGIDRAELWRQNLPRLPSYVGYWRLHKDVAGRGLGELAQLAHAGRVPHGDLVLVLQGSRANAVLERAFRERPELREFDAIAHEQVVQRFRRADAATFAVNRARLAELHWKNLPAPVGYGQVGLIKRESAKKARHLPIRQLMDQAGNAVQAMKPVFLMSPLSVASYLPPGALGFDLVVFDEASQVKPVDAFGAILRGRRLVVVGDEKQLPPTSFFDAMLSPEGVLDEEDVEPESVTQDMQSVLGLCASKGMSSRMLRWHYRSRHDSLIALSNQEFYDNHLVIFPSPQRGREGEGLAYRHLPKTVYERGTSRSNPLEADAVVEAVVGHAKTRPHLSLGVVAFSMAQREAIEDRIEALSKRTPELDAFVNDPRDECFFVKNLENVQGDERDVILISVGYGRDAQGGLSMNFGPLNQAGGERRLNVLITRARRQCAVFTNLAPDDLDLKRASGAGVKAFKAFLAFAKDGRLSGPAAASGPADEHSEFEVQVAAALTRAGYAVERQVGSGGYRVDLAVVDPRTPGRYLLGIECDGARYHGARWARDRDRLRQSVLENLGWRIHRVWSSDWFRNRDEALRRGVAAIEAAKPEKREARRPDAEGVKRQDDAPPPGPPPLPKYELSRAEIRLGDTHLAEVSSDDLAEFLAAIVEDESPVHAEEIRRRLLEGRAGSRRVAAVEEAIQRAEGKGLVARRGEFLWSKKERPVLPRDRTDLPDAMRGHATVSDEECRAALVRAVAESCGAPADEAVSQAIRILGVKRGDEAQARFMALAQGLIASGAFHRSPSGSLTL